MTRLALGDLLIDPQHLTWLDNRVRGLFDTEAGSAFGKVARLAYADDEDDEGKADPDDFWNPRMALYRPYPVRNGVLVIPVNGVLLHKFPYHLGGWATGYDYIAAAVARGVADPRVRMVVLDIDTAGGQVSGCFDCADMIASMRGTKPIVALAADMALSGGYAIASAADRILVTQTGQVGSVGVVLTHTEVSGALEAEGVKVTLIYSGAQKVDGNPYEPLPEDVRARFQERSDSIYSLFVALVARNRGISEATVRGSEAAVMGAVEAVSRRFADQIGTLAVAQMIANLSYGDEMMTDKTSAADAAALSAARAEGATAERARIASILALPECKGREALAQQIALSTSLSADEAKALLAAAAPTVQQAAPKTETRSASAFERAMASGNPDVGVATSKPQSFADSVFGSVGIGPKN